MDKVLHAKIKQDISDLNTVISKISSEASIKEGISMDQARDTITSKIYNYIFTRIKPKAEKITNHADALYAKI